MKKNITDVIWHKTMNSNVEQVVKNAPTFRTQKIYGFVLISFLFSLTNLWSSRRLNFWEEKTKLLLFKMRKKLIKFFDKDKCENWIIFKNIKITKMECFWWRMKFDQNWKFVRILNLKKFWNFFWLNFSQNLLNLEV